MDTLISIVMPAYNSARYITRAIESVRYQTYSNWELIVVDDASTDDTYGVSSQFSFDRRIRVISLQENSGPSHARNVGIQCAKGKWIAFLDADDTWQPEKLERQLDKIKSTPNAKVCFSEYRCVSTTSDQQTGYRRLPSVLSYDRLLKSNFVGCSTCMFEHSAFPESTFIDPANFKPRGILSKAVYVLCKGKIHHEDYLFWLNMFARSKEKGFSVVGLREPLVTYRVSSESLSGSKFRAALFQLYIYQTCLRFGIFRTWLFFLSYAFIAIRNRV